MRLAALYDIHGNLPALDAVLAEVQAAGADRIVIGGDVLPGPMPRETLDRLLALDVPIDYLFGNGEVAILNEMKGTPSPAMPETYRPMLQWNAEQVSAARALLEGWPATVRLDVPGLGAVLFCHATPRNEDEIFTRVTPEARLRPLFDSLGVSLVVCGHTHMQFDRMVGATRVVNAGSVGLPVGVAGADWLLLDSSVQLRHTNYDVTAAAERMASTPCPLAREFFAQQLRQPFDEAQMLAAFEAVAVA